MQQSWGLNPRSKAEARSQEEDRAKGLEPAQAATKPEEPAQNRLNLWDFPS